MESYTNYVTLAGHFVDYLMAIAGASLTVLTVVMAFDKKPQNASMQPLLICSLIVAIVASFIGIHQFASISSLEGTEALLNKAQLGVRQYLIAYMNIAISANFFLMAMLLLTPAYELESARYVWRLLTLIFTSLIVIQVAWTLEDVYLISKSIEKALPIMISAFCIGFVAFFLLVVDTRKKLQSGRPESAAFMVCVFVSIASLIVEMVFPGGEVEVESLDLYFFAIGSCLIYASIGSIGAIGLKDVKQELTVENGETI